MTFLPSALALIAGTAVLAAPAAAPVAPIKYKAVISSKQVVDLSAMGGGNQENAQVSTTYFQLAVIDSAGGHILHIVVDSLVPDPSVASQIPAPILDSAKGAVFHHFVDAKGGLTEKTLTAGGPLASAFAGSVMEFVPRLQGAISTGRSWSDTTESARTIPNGALKVKSVANYQVIDASTVNAAFASSQTGAQETPGGTAEIAGTSTGTVSWTVGADKSFTKAVRSESTKLTVTLAAAPAPIPVTQTQEATITRLP